MSLVFGSASLVGNVDGGNVESANPEDLQAQLRALQADILARTPTAQLAIFNLAGAGAGHFFIAGMVCPAMGSGSGLPLIDLRFGVGIGANAVAASAAAQVAIMDLIANGYTKLVGIDGAGASDGHRFCSVVIGQKP